MTCGIYARKSTDQNGVADDQESVARQVEHAKAYATRKGWTCPAPAPCGMRDGLRTGVRLQWRALGETTQNVLMH
jgi:hypothetical protein